MRVESADKRAKAGRIKSVTLFTEPPAVPPDCFVLAGTGYLLEKVGLHSFLLCH